MKAQADRDTCIGAGVCTTLTEVFTLAADGKVEIAIDGEVPPSELSGVEEAVALCPVQALSLTSQLEGEEDS